MPVHLVRADSHEFVAHAKHSSNREFHQSVDNSVHIGLINNMPDGALKATERQFQTLLESAANGVVVHLSLYAFPDVPRTESGRRHVGRFYSDIENLWNSHLDGLIVTGAEPQAPNLKDEPYWGNMTKVIEWAEYNTHSTVWSCLAAHAALLHIDDIGRRRLGSKRFGVFECARASDHQLTNGVPSLLQVPHSRWNDIPEAELADCGYCILTRAKDGGVDAFAKQRRSLSLFFQGHPEYEVNTLLLEYRRDVGRYLSRERYIPGDAGGLLRRRYHSRVDNAARASSLSASQRVARGLSGCLGARTYRQHVASGRNAGLRKLAELFICAEGSPVEGATALEASSTSPRGWFKHIFAES